jgi:glycerophosphoryl diester phosphodiesterase
MSFIEKIMKSLILLIIILLCIITSLFSVLRKKLVFISKIKRLRHPQDIFSPHIPFIEAHCGVNKEIFQNTLESFSKAIEYGIGSLETDVWLTKDNVLVLVHASRTGGLSDYYNHNGNIQDLNWDEISTLRTIKDNLTMPRMIDVLKLAKNKIYIDLEIKDPRVELVFPKVIKLIEEYDFFDQISICSLHHEYYNKIEEYNKKNNRNLLFGFGYRKNQTNLIDFTKKGNTINIHWKETTKEICAKAHENGMGVVSWFGLDEDENLENYKSVIETGADVIVANYPLLAKKYRDSLYEE